MRLDLAVEQGLAVLADGLCDVDTRTIYVRRSLGFRRTAEVLGHELGHAFNDWRHWVRDTLA